MSQRTWFQHLLDDNNAIELRVSDGIRWASGYYDDLDALLRDIDHFNEYGCNVYTSLNKPTHYVVTNRILDKAKALRDADIEQYTRLLIDLDPERSESPSSDDELERAREAARRVGPGGDKLQWSRSTGLGRGLEERGGERGKRHEKA